MEHKELIFLYLVTNAFRTYVIFKFLRLFWDHGKTGPLAEFLAYCLFYTAASYSYLRLNIPIATLAVNISGLFLVSCIYRLSWKSRVFAIVFCYAVLMCTETIVIYLSGFHSLSPIKSNVYDIGWSSMAINLFPYAIVLILEKAKEFRKGSELSAPYCLASLFVPAASVYLSIAVVKDANQSMEVVFPVSLLLLQNVLVFYLYDKATVIEQKKREEEILKSQNQYYRFQYELMNASLEHTKALRHDLKNHWAIICGLLEEGETKRASDYASGLVSYTYGADVYAHSGCLEIDCILNFKLQQAANKDIVVELTVDIPANLDAAPSMIAVIFGNLLDNAVNAAANANDKWMKISVRHKKGILYLDIINSYDGLVLPDYKSRKKNPASHGIGLANVARAVRENHGILKLSHDEKAFYASLFFYLND